MKAQITFNTLVNKAILMRENHSFIQTVKDIEDCENIRYNGLFNNLIFCFNIDGYNYYFVSEVTEKEGRLLQYFRLINL